MSLLQSPPGAYAVIDGRRCLYFMGTGYLGLQGHPEVIRAACEAAQQYGIHAATTRAGWGNSPPLVDLERRAADFFGAEGAFCFASGYAVNYVMLAVLASQKADQKGTVPFSAALANQKGTVPFSPTMQAWCPENWDSPQIFVDELSHYSAHEAAAATGRAVHRFRHQDADDLAAKLQSQLPAGGRPLVLTDGVFAARGSIAPLDRYVQVLQNYAGGTILVDDAHAVGVLGANGRGTWEFFNLADQGINEIRVQHNLCATAGLPSSTDGTVGQANRGTRLLGPLGGQCYFGATLSKALGGYGGVIPGSESFLDEVKSASHWYDGATPLPAPVAAASAKALELIRTDPRLRERLQANVRHLKTGLRQMGFPIDDTPVPIVCLSLGDAANMRRIQRTLFEQNIAVAYLAAYAGLGPEGALRLAVFATHTPEMIDELLNALRRVG